MAEQSMQVKAEEYLAELEQPSDAFNNFYHWFFSMEKDAVFARARCDVPYTLLTGLAGRELAVAKRMVYGTIMNHTSGLYFYLNAVRALEDRDAVPALKQALLAASRDNNPMEKKACLETLYVLTNNLWYWMQGLLIRPRV